MVYDTENRMRGSRAISAFTRLVLPAPDGAATTYKRPVCDEADKPRYSND